MSNEIKEGPLLVENRGQLKVITFNQPQKKNAINPEMSRQLRQAVEESRDDDCRVILLQGQGEDFCAGADLDPNLLNQDGGFDVASFLRETYNPTILAMREINKPFIAKVRGNAVGVGFNFALGCDMIIAGESARFCQIFTKIGLSSDGGGAFFLYERLGYHRAYEFLVNHRMIDAQEAFQLGLVNHVRSDGELDDYVEDLVNDLITGPYQAILHSKANLRAATLKNLKSTLEAEAEHQGKNFVSKDFFEGVMAFLQRRPAKFQGK